MGTFENLSAINVNDHTEKKEGLTYLTWSWAWDEIKRKYPDATYAIWKNDQGIPYVYDELTGFMVYTSMTIEGITHEMWLPVMDSKNKAMKAHPYTYTTRYGEKTVEGATMFDINKTIMRCLVKNMAMFGLGLYIYAGEDLPSEATEGEEEPQANKNTKTNKKAVTEPQANPQSDPVEEAHLKSQIMAFVNRHKMDAEKIKKICTIYNVNSLNELSAYQCRDYINKLENSGGNINE